MRLVQDPAEQTTAATDIILAFVAFGGIFLLHFYLENKSELWRINIWSAAIGLIGLAAALGAAAHGLDLLPTIQNRIWLVLNMALALAVSLFVVGVVYDLWGYEASIRTLPLMLIAGLGFYLATLFYPGIFFLFVIYEALPLSFAFCAYLFLAFTGEPGTGFMASGVMISIIAAGLQTRKSMVFMLVWKFDHNGIYHLVQTIGLLFLIAGLLGMTIFD